MPVLAPNKSPDSPIISELGQLLLDAADVIENRGWVQKNAGNPAIGYCALGALQVAALRQVPAPVWNRTLFHHNALFTRLMNYNDSEGRTKEEVVSLLRELAVTV